MEQKKMELVQGKVFKIEPGKKYLLVFKKGSVSMADAEAIMAVIRDDFGAASLAVNLDDPANLKIVEVTES